MAEETADLRKSILFLFFRSCIVSNLQSVDWKDNVKVNVETTWGSSACAETESLYKDHVHRAPRFAGDL